MKLHFNNQYNLKNYQIKYNYSSRNFIEKSHQNINFKGVFVKNNDAYKNYTLKPIIEPIKTFFLKLKPNKPSIQKQISSLNPTQNIFETIKNTNNLSKECRNILDLPKNFIIYKEFYPKLYTNSKTLENIIKKEIKTDTIDKINKIITEDYSINWGYIIKSSDNSPKEIKQKLNTILETINICERLESKKYNPIKNNIWAKKCNIIINFNKEKIQNNKSFKNLLAETAEAYNKIFEEEKYNHRGVSRITTKNTICTPYDEKHYFEYINKFKPLINKERSATFKDLKLTQIVIFDDKRNMFHPMPEDIPAGIKYCDKYYQEILPISSKYKKIKSLSLDEKLNATQNIARIHYILSNITPFERGSAGIANIITRSLYKSIGLNLPATKKNIALDLEAFHLSMPDYVKQWHSFFELP